MKKPRYLIIAGAILLSLLQFQYGSCQSYDGNLVEIMTVDCWQGVMFDAITMSREGKRVKVKYFTGASGGTPVDERYRRWAANRNIILATSGTYMDKCGGDAKSVGMTIDNGVTVNRYFNRDFGALVTVNASGGVFVSNIDEGSCFMSCEGSYTKFDVRNSTDRSRFIRCAEADDATVFQAHLLVWKDELTVSRPSSSITGSGRKAERRYWLVGIDVDGNVKHSLMQATQPTTLYDGAVAAKNLAYDCLDIDEVAFLINLDPGCQDVLEVRDKAGQRRLDIRGGFTDISKAANLLVYYYE